VRSPALRFGTSSGDIIPLHVLYVSPQNAIIVLNATSYNQ
jgi:hypothetical protein